ncbi:hypothetical protein S40288_05899 [Stachybotrys chartarum IBT 40288]|nr:hypothetical protein S40288_05899 [Stachybotrys chartarum IBT 40288]
MSEYSSTFLDMGNIMNVSCVAVIDAGNRRTKLTSSKAPSLSPVSLMSDWTSLDTQLGDFSYADTTFSNLDMSPCSYTSADSSLACFPLPFAVTNTNCLPMNLGFQRNWTEGVTSVDNQFMSTLNSGVAPSPSPPVLSPPLPSPAMTNNGGLNLDQTTTKSPPENNKSSLPVKEASSRPQSPKRKPQRNQKVKKRQVTPAKAGPVSASTAAAPTRPQSNLRTATRAPKRACNMKRTAEDAGSDSDSRARHAHNQVELHYRQRLNGYFERLLAALPARDVNGDDGDSDEEDDGQYRRKVSKAEVLDLARRRIEALEWEVATLAQEKKEMGKAREQMAKALGRRMTSNVVQ